MFDATTPTVIFRELSAEHAKSRKDIVHYQQSLCGISSGHSWPPRLSYITVTMGDYYHQFLTTMSGEGYLPTSPDELNSVFVPGVSLPLSTPPIHSPYPSNIGGFFAGYGEPTVINVNVPKASKSRRRSAASQGGNADQVKHRRTRSGCYTCRNRRVKASQKRRVWTSNFDSVADTL